VPQAAEGLDLAGVAPAAGTAFSASSKVVTSTVAPGRPGSALEGRGHDRRTALRLMTARYAEVSRTDLPIHQWSIGCKDWGPKQKIPVVVATFRYSDEEVERIEADLGPGALHSPEFTVTIGYRATAKTFTDRYNEAAIVKHLRSGLDLSSTATTEVRTFC
jgi:hypothetical protein